MHSQGSTWAYVPLNECVEILDHKRIPVNADERNKRIAGKNQDELFPYYGATGNVGWIDGYIFDEELVLLGEDGAPFLDPNKSKAYLAKGRYWVNNHAHVLKAKQGVINSLFLLHYLNHFDYHDYVTGTTRLKLNQAQLKKFPILLPHLEEQEKIVCKIEELYSQLDVGEATLRRIKQRLQRYKASILKAACEGRLVPQQPGDEPAEALLRRLGKQPLAGEGLGSLPEGWCWARTGDLASMGTGATPLRSNQRYWIGGKIPWITSGAVNKPFVTEAEEFITELALKETNVKLFPQGTLVVAMYGEGKTRGKVSELSIEATTNQACAALVFNEITSDLQPYVKLYYQKNYEDIRRLSSGGVQPNLNLSIIRDTKIPLPPSPEQNRIVSEVERLFSIVDTVEQIVKAKLAQAARLRQAVLKAAFEGRL